MTMHSYASVLSAAKESSETSGKKGNSFNLPRKGNCIKKKENRTINCFVSLKHIEVSGAES